MNEITVKEKCDVTFSIVITKSMANAIDKLAVSTKNKKSEVTRQLLSIGLKTVKS